MTSTQPRRRTWLWDRSAVSGRRLTLVIVMVGLVLATIAVSAAVLNRVTVQVRRDALRERVHSTAAVVEAIVRQAGDRETALTILRRARDEAPSLGTTGEITIGRFVGDSIELVFRRTSSEIDAATLTVPAAGNLAEPMQRALAGDSGWMIGRDYDGTKVLAAYNALPTEGWGIVAKTDMREVRAPFVRALAVTIPVALLLVVAGAALFLRLSEPMISALEASESRFRSLIQRGSDIISLLAPDGTILYESPSVKRVLGRSPEELEGHSVEELVHPDDLAAVQSAIADALANPGQPYDLEVRLRHADGSWRWLAVTGTNMLDDPAVAAIVANSRDVTAQKRSQQELQRRTRELTERVKELGCLLRLSHLLAEPDLSEERIGTETVALIPPAWQHPSATAARLRIGDTTFETPGFRETASMLRADFSDDDGQIGRLEVAHLEDGPFLPEEEQLVEAIAARIGEAIEHLRAEAALTASEKRYRTLFNEVPVGLYRTSADGRFLDANPALAEILGHPDVASLLATPLSEVYADAADREQWRAVLLETGEVQGTEIQVRRPDGSVSWVRHSARLVRRPEDGTIVFEGAAEDITERKRAEEALRQSEQFLRQSQRVGRLGGWEYDVAEQRVTWTDEAYRIHGVTPETYDPSEPDRDIDFFAPGDRERIADAFGRAVSDGEPYDLEVQLEAADGRTLWVHVVGEADVVEGHVRRVYGTIADITERKRAALALAETMAELERSNAELQQFAYVASHDLQEPLRMVVSYLGLLERRIGSELDERARTFMDFAVDGGRRMQRLIHDLLAYSRVQTHGADFETVDLGRVAEIATRNLEAAIEEAGAEVVWDELPTVEGDEGQLVQLLQNLVGNAIKFRGPAPPRVEVTAVPADDGWRISVRDNGIGIAEEHAGRIFDVFQRLHTRAEYPGTGIGLAICKRIAERHGGRIWVESAPEAGATFHVVLRGGKESRDDP